MGRSGSGGPGAAVPRRGVGPAGEAGTRRASPRHSRTGRESRPSEPPGAGRTREGAPAGAACGGRGRRRTAGACPGRAAVGPQEEGPGPGERWAAWGGTAARRAEAAARSPSALGRAVARPATGSPDSPASARAPVPAPGAAPWAARRPATALFPGRRASPQGAAPEVAAPEPPRVRRIPVPGSWRPERPGAPRGNDGHDRSSPLVLPPDMSPNVRSRTGRQQPKATCTPLPTELVPETADPRRCFRSVTVSLRLLPFPAT
ncbi:hypothetical protein DFJ69_2946 [Thermomonospora umbrina]|uniref:Uncharacterized protein n=1 Tax=Thermomonospora umbrina TaxID=111806 RepID=A0A3D9STX4_9ACTN|nr:hypothetical protein DFJ69_2946 [Thermomonospora umbrina]